MRPLLAFETSCDDTAVAIIDNSGAILADVIYSQTLEHEPYGGVVPEIGSRSHLEQILPTFRKALADACLKPDDIKAVAATFAPGLIGPLMVGAQFAKGFAVARNIPLIAIHHIEGHVLAGLSETGFPEGPFLALIASGGHTAIYMCDAHTNIITLGQTLDDAAGEAFDKIGRALGFSYPSGKKIDELSKNGDKERFKMPIALRDRLSYDFSFSGLKTAALKIIHSSNFFKDDNAINDLCASLQYAIGTALVEKTVRAAKEFNIFQIVVGGGVAANSFLRASMADSCAEYGLKLFLPELRHCTDNAVMIARAALMKMKKNQNSSLLLDVMANMPIEQKNELYL